MTQNERKHIRALHQKKHRQAAQAFLVEGEKNVAELLQHRLLTIQKIFATPVFLQTHAAILAGITVVETTAGLLSKAGTLQNNQQAIAIVEMPEETSLPTHLKGLTLVLDQVRDPGNLGTILRLADWYAISHIICAPHTVDLYNPKVIAASMGSFARVQIHQMPLMPLLSQSVLPVWGATMDGTNADQMSWPDELFLVLGSESHGLSDELAAQLDERITIPRFGAAESLNVALATGILVDRWRGRHR
ncbi:MAG: TrmH family RNA methyltransferase [Bernardetiaceae bacterium]